MTEDENCLKNPVIVLKKNIQQQQCKLHYKEEM